MLIFCEDAIPAYCIITLGTQETGLVNYGQLCKNLCEFHCLLIDGSVFCLYV